MRFKYILFGWAVSVKAVVADSWSARPRCMLGPRIQLRHIHVACGFWAHTMQTTPLSFSWPSTWHRVSRADLPSRHSNSPCEGRHLQMSHSRSGRVHHENLEIFVPEPEAICWPCTSKCSVPARAVHHQVLPRTVAD